MRTYYVFCAQLEYDQTDDIVAGIARNKLYLSLCLKMYIHWHNVFYIIVREQV